MGFRGLEGAIIDSCHVWFDGWLIDCHAALIWSFPICIRKSLPTMCCGPLTSRLNHFERPCVLFTLSLVCRTLSHTQCAFTHIVSLMVKWLTKKWKKGRGGQSGFTVRHQTHTSCREHHTPMCTCSFVHFEHTQTQSHCIQWVEEAGGVG